MAVTVSGTGITFNDATTQTTAFTGAGGVTSAVAGNGVAVSGATGAVTFSLGAPSSGSIGTYVPAMNNTTNTTVLVTVGTTTAGSTLQYWTYPTTESWSSFQSAGSGAGGYASFGYSGTWRAMGYSRQDPSSYGQLQPNLWLRIA